MGQDGGGAPFRTHALRGAISLALAFLALSLSACTASSGDEATGIVVDVQGDLEDIERFTVLVDGEEMVFEPSPAGEYAFPLGHLRDHLRSGEPVLVRWEEDGDRMVAMFIDDA